MARKRSKILRHFPARARVTTLANAARRTIAEQETLVLSERDRQAFFDALIDPPRLSKRLVRALSEHRRRVIMGR